MSTNVGRLEQQGDIRTLAVAPSTSQIEVAPRW